MKAVKVMGRVDESGELCLDTPLLDNKNSRVEIIVLIPEVEKIDEDDEPTEKILENLRQSLQDVKEGRVHDISELWDGIDAE